MSEPHYPLDFVSIILDFLHDCSFRRLRRGNFTHKENTLSISRTYIRYILIPLHYLVDNKEFNI